MTGYGETVGAPLTEHRDVRLISFTGSTETGRLVASSCAERNAICSLEMGGKNVIIVMDDADVDLAVEGAVWGAFGTSGQRCTASSRIVVHKKVYKKFTQKLVERAASLRVGNGARQEDTDMGPVINADAVHKILGYVEIGEKEDGATTRAVAANDSTRDAHAHGYFIEPTVFTDVAPDDARRAGRNLRPRHLGHSRRHRSKRRSRSRNGVRYGLSASIYTRDVNRAFHAMNEMYTGIFYVNSSTIGAEVHLPFGGTKAPATATARRARRSSTSSPNGSRSTSTTAANCSARRLTKCSLSNSES